MSARPSLSAFPKMLNISIGRRLTLGFAIVLAIVIILGVKAVSDVETTAGTTVDLYEHPFTVTSGLATVRNGIFVTYDALRQASASDASAALDATELANLRQSPLAALDLAGARYLGPKSDFQNLRDVTAAFFAAADHVALLISDGKRDVARALLLQDGRLAFKSAVKSATTMVNFANDKGRGFVAAAQDRMSATVRLLSILTGVALLVGALITYQVTRSITRPLAALRDTMLRLAAGDYTAEVAGLQRGDEVGSMATAVEVFKQNGIDGDRLRTDQEAQKLRVQQERRQSMLDLAVKFEAGVGGIVGSVASAATGLRVTAKSMAATAESTTLQSAAVAAASEQASLNVQTVASASEELSASIREISQQVAHAGALIEGSVQQTVKSNEQVRGLTKFERRKLAT